MSKFNVGDRVVAIENLGYGPYTVLEKGKEYIINSTYINTDYLILVGDPFLGFTSFSDEVLIPVTEYMKHCEEFNKKLLDI